MKTHYKKISVFFQVTSLFLSTSFANADTVKNSKELAFNIPFFNFFDAQPEEKTQEGTDVSDETTIASNAKAPSKDARVACEYFDSTSDNVLILENASADAKQKIENVEDTLNEETSLRDTIFGSLKGLAGLQKKDKVIFREMKNEIADAKTYYNDLDKKVETTHNYLSENICEDEDLEKVIKIDEETQDLVQDENTYRKQFAGSLKEKMRILQNSVKDAKK
jgi:hypothetical protein